MRINSLVDASELEKGVAVLSSEESHHLARVLRVQPGQEITLFDGQGGVADAVIESVSKTAVEARISKRWQEPAPSVEIDLIQAVPKPERWELVLQKAVELGATTIRPVLSQHTEFKPNPKKQERWSKIVLNAAQQCEVRWLPVLQPLEKFDAVLSSLGSYDLVLIGSLYEGTKPFREVPKAGKSKVAMLIGPEGDFSEEEVEAAVLAGAVPVSFGDRILRTETAAIYGLSVLAYELL
ncbi:RsmE family RNA methyltransferase [Pontiella sulfatireligans]|uniref:Ribosomal RNA small subunit methyltransferase E n=1 Tax=Pontiella sulfatireligans TaxID=2750658 RepID=A0A6C2UT14_9BACT|nr:RsmE family RNA methyltransferase [Pontiella sulfatireligans]VGO23103.1 Ribosomal RNA small subunit methyltransferase E [Pontiella sulfatireligans]